MGVITIRIDEIRSIATVAECRSITRAAEKLFMTQPALSQSIKRIEDKLGTKLLVRDQNDVYPTEAGQLFVESGKKILAEYDDMINRIAEYDAHALRLGIGAFYGRQYLSRIIPIYKKQYPDVKVYLTEETSQKLELLTRENKLDLCMIPLPLVHESLCSTVIRTEEILLALPPEHPYNENHSTESPVELADFADDYWIFPNNAQRFAVMGMKLCEDAGFKPNISIETMSWDTVDNMISIGEGIGFVPDTVKDIIRPRKPMYYHIKACDVRRKYAAVYSADARNMGHISSFINIARQVLNDSKYGV